MTFSLVRPTCWGHKNVTKLHDYEFKDGTTVPMFGIDNFQLLTQLIGYIKHINIDWDIYYRGQSSNYDNMRPAIFRKRKDSRGRTYEVNMEKKNRKLNEFIADRNNDFLKMAIPSYAVEPTLQHYGILTRWLDLVDNIWVALWFGLHTEYRRINNINFTYVEQRQDNGKQYIYM